MSDINKKTIKYLGELGRIKVGGDKENKLLEDLEGILGNFKELEELDTPDVPQIRGGIFVHNVFRDDGAGSRLDGTKAVQAFPEKENEFLKIPPVFE